MIIIPAIDLLDGSCVRLYRGNYSQSTVYDLDPVRRAVSFAEAGARRIHLVDLNAARGDSRNNRETVGRIRGSVEALLQVGGGIRSQGDIDELTQIGIDRLVVGTSLVTAPDEVRRWAQAAAGRIIAGIDARDGMIRISGWERETEMRDEEAAKRAAELGAAEIIYTNIARDGTMEGPDLDSCARIAQAAGLPVIVSGGVRGAEDFEAVSRRESEGLMGVIAGKALYEGTFDLAEALTHYSPA
jgi:phosphoribosylformimino-5-aminoimidazole carboxamide ribotide isomerase